MSCSGRFDGSDRTVRNLALWVGQIVMAGFFVMAGSLKLFVPADDLARRMPYADGIPMELTRFIGVCELLGAAGLVLPGLARDAAWLTPLAAAGLASIAALATLFHVGREEWASIPLPLGLAMYSVFIAWSRAGLAPLKR